MSSPSSSPPPLLPSQPIDAIVGPLARFLHIEAAGGVVLLLCAFVALGLANSPWADAVSGFWETQVGVSVGAFEFKHSLRHLINDGLMVVFFFVVGCEVKREFVLGELRDPRRALLPLVAAFGGMLAPAAIYFTLQYNQPGVHGWGIPMATDIAFVVGCMALLGSRVPHSLRVLLLTLAIVDDIGAILVIAIGYSEQLQWHWLSVAVAGLAAVHACHRLGVRSFAVYFGLGVIVWFAVHESGVHATIAGVVLGLMTPANSYLNADLAQRVLDRARHALDLKSPEHAAGRPTRVRHFRWLARESVSPLEYLINRLHPWVTFGVMPLFAVANAGVPIQLQDLTSTVSFAVVAGLVIGKPLGIVAMSWLSVRVGWARLPDGITWRTMVGGGCLAGIGFTMALFISGLALAQPLLDHAKVGVLVGSFVSALIGMLYLSSGPLAQSQSSHP